MHPITSPRSVHGAAVYRITGVINFKRESGIQKGAGTWICAAASARLAASGPIAGLVLFNPSYERARARVCTMRDRNIT